MPRSILRDKYLLLERRKTMNTLYYRDWQENNDAVVLKLEISDLKIKWLFNIWTDKRTRVLLNQQSMNILVNPTCFNTLNHFNNTLLNPTCFINLNHHCNNTLLNPTCFSTLNHQCNNTLLNPTCFNPSNHHFINTLLNPTWFNPLNHHVINT